MSVKNIWYLLRETFSEWSEDKAPRLAAALAYYTAFSLAPILVIAIAVVGIFYQSQAAQNLVVNQMNSLIGEEGGDLIKTMLEASSQLGSNILATIIGLVALVFGATGVFGQLQDSLNTMWEVKPKPNGGLVRLIRDRFFSFTMVIGVGFLLLISLLISAVLAALNTWSLGLFPEFKIVMQVINFLVSFLVITVIFALLFKYVPDAEIAWKDVWLGAAFTALLFEIGKWLIGLYLGNSGAVDSFGAAGSLVLLLLWVYYSAQISFFGAEFTQVYANKFGSKVVPDEKAVKLTEKERAEQGIPHQGTFERAVRSETSVERQARREKDTRQAPGRRAGAGGFIPATGDGSGKQPEAHSAVIRPVVEEEPPLTPAERSVRSFISLTTTAAGLAAGYLMGVRRRSGRKR